MSHKTTDPVVNNMRYALISVIGENFNQKNQTAAFKIRGAFATEEEARKHAQDLSRTDPDYDVFLISMYEWLALQPPPLEDIEEVRYPNDKLLDDIFTEYFSQQKLVKQEYETRKKWQGDQTTAADAAPAPAAASPEVVSEAGPSSSPSSSPA